MFFKLEDGVPIWAIATTEVERLNWDENGNLITTTKTGHLYTIEELAKYPEYELLEPPSPEIVARAAQIEGTVFSHTEFERLLTEKTPKEMKIETLENENAILALELVQSQVALDQVQSEQAALLLALIQAEVM